MDKIVYVYGSARDAATRVARRGAVPRQQQVRLGPWIIRPARRTAVDFVQLAKYEREVLEKVRVGLIQIQNGDEVIYSIEELTAAFAELKSGKGGVDLAAMPIAELYELMRSETPSQDVWDVFVQRSLTEDDPSFPPVDERLASLTRYSATLATKGLDMSKAEALFAQAREKLAEEASTKAEEALAAAQTAEESAKALAAVEAVEKVEETPAQPETLPAPVEPSPEQMDFSTPETPAEEPSAIELDPRAERLAKLPEGWKGLTNTKLIEMMSGLGIEVPERQNKASLTAAVEKWVEGS